MDPDERATQQLVREHMSGLGIFPSMPGEAETVDPKKAMKLLVIVALKTIKSACEGFRMLWAE